MSDYKFKDISIKIIDSDEQIAVSAKWSLEVNGELTMHGIASKASESGKIREDGLPPKNLILEVIDALYEVTDSQIDQLPRQQRHCPYI